MNIIRLDDTGKQIKPWLQTATPIQNKTDPLDVRVVKNNRSAGFLERLFLRKHYSKIIDAWVEDDKGTYRIRVTEEYDGLFSGKTRRNTYYMNCFPGGNDYAWYTSCFTEACEKCLEIIWKGKQ